MSLIRKATLAFALLASANGSNASIVPGPVGHLGGSITWSSQSIADGYHVCVTPFDAVTHAPPPGIGSKGAVCGQSLVSYGMSLPANRHYSIRLEVTGHPHYTRTWLNIWVPESGSAQAHFDMTGLMPASAGPAVPVNMPNDPGIALQWFLKRTTEFLGTGAFYATTGTGVDGTGQVIAIVDTGYRAHPDLPAKGSDRFVAGYNFVDRNANYDDPGTSHDPQFAYHGTMVSAAALGTSNNGAGGSGIAPGATLMPIVGVKANGSDIQSPVARAITWASGGTVEGMAPPAKKADVINLSLSARGACPKRMQEAIDGALARNVPVVAAAGNFSENFETEYPANCKGVISVGASFEWGELYADSNYGKMTLVAPGHQIYTALFFRASPTGPDEAKYGFVSGTSFSAALVSGTIALMKQVNPSLTPAQIKQMLTDTLQPYPARAECPYGDCGPGILDTLQAVALAAGWTKKVVDAKSMSLVNSAALVLRPDPTQEGAEQQPTTMVGRVSSGGELPPQRFRAATVGWVGANMVLYSHYTRHFTCLQGNGHGNERSVVYAHYFDACESATAWWVPVPAGPGSSSSFRLVHPTTGFYMGSKAENNKQLGRLVDTLDDAVKVRFETDYIHDEL